MYFMHSGRDEMKPVKTGWLIKQIYFLNQARLNAMFAQYDLTATQTYTLIYLFRAHEEGRTVYQRNIEVDMDISNPTVTGILNRLEAKGLIERKINTADARVKNIEVTPKALALDKILRERFAENDAALVACLDDAEKKQLVELLERILTAADAKRESTAADQKVGKRETKEGGIR